MVLSKSQIFLAGRAKIAILIWSFSFFIFFSHQEVDAIIPEGGRVIFPLPPCHFPIPGSVWTLSFNLALKIPFPELRFPLSPRPNYLPPLPLTNTYGAALPIALPCCWIIPPIVVCNPIPGFLPSPVLYGSSL